VFEAGPELGRTIPAGAKVTLSSSDGFINASGAWPAFSKPRARHWGRIAAVIAVLIGGRGLGAGQELAAAGYDHRAFDRFLASCGDSCPADLAGEAHSRLDVLAAEEARYPAAQGDADKERGRMGWPSPYATSPGRRRSVCAPAIAVSALRARSRPSWWGDRPRDSYGPSDGEVAPRKDALLRAAQIRERTTKGGELPSLVMLPGPAPDRSLDRGKCRDEETRSGGVALGTRFNKAKRNVLTKDCLK
jgi:hypothetical protein